MVLPLIPLIAAGVAGSAISSLSSLYSQGKQRDLYRYQIGGYQRALNDWQKNVPGRKIRYPEISYEGKIRSLETGISQSYANTSSTLGNEMRTLATYGGIYRAGELYGQSAGYTKRWL